MENGKGKGNKNGKGKMGKNENKKWKINKQTFKCVRVRVSAYF